MSQEVKFTEEEIAEIKQVQGNYQSIGLELVQIKLAILARFVKDGQVYNM